MKVKETDATQKTQQIYLMIIDEDEFPLVRSKLGCCRRLPLTKFACIILDISYYKLFIPRVQFIPLRLRLRHCRQTRTNVANVIIVANIYDVRTIVANSIYDVRRTHFSFALISASFRSPHRRPLPLLLSPLRVRSVHVSIIFSAAHFISSTILSAISQTHLTNNAAERF